MANELNEKVKLSIQNLRDKKSKIYFLVQDTKGNAKASVRYIYQMALTLKNNGFNPIILHERNDYTSVNTWLGDEYNDLPHESIEGQNLEVTPDDFLIIPEIFGYVMDQVKKLPCAKIVLTQSYAYMLETLQPGQSWSQFGFYKCITTTIKQKEYIEKIMRQNTFDIVEPYISENFYPKGVPPMPLIGIHTKDHSDTINIIKAFYLKFPQYRWFTFRDLRGLSESEFAKSLRDCFMSVWIDDDCGFGTFPLESMKSEVPVIGKIPNIVPEWMSDENGMWINDKTIMIDVIADFIQNWLEDNINPGLYDEMKKTSEMYSNKSLFETKIITLFDTYFNQRADSFEEQLSKTEN
jgi:hypothetical protein